MSGEGTGCAVRGLPEGHRERGGDGAFAGQSKGLWWGAGTVSGGETLGQGTVPPAASALLRAIPYVTCMFVCDPMCTVRFAVFHLICVQYVCATRVGVQPHVQCACSYLQLGV